jgi:type I restriction enzyme S subunit
VSGDELPEGWASTTLSTICTHRSGSSKLIKGRLEAGPGPTLFKAFSASGQDVWCKSWEHEGSAVVVSAVGARCGKAFKADGQWAAIANTHVVWAGPSVDRDFLFLHLNNEQFWERGGSAQPFVKVTATFDRDFSLPPLAEQKRIVAKVEELLARANAARERLARVPAILKRFRQAVLAAACDGGLTEGWRVGDTGGSRSVPLREVVESLDQGWSPQCEAAASPSSEEWGVIKTTAVQRLWFDESENKRLPAQLSPRKDLEVRPGDLLITRAGPRARAGVTCLVRAVRPRLMICDKVYRLRLRPALASADFVNLVLNEPSVLGEIDSMKTGTSDSGVNLTQGKLLALEISLPTVDEQREIVRRVGSLFKLADAIEKRVAAATARAEKVTQAILAKAFRGELVPTEAEMARRDRRDYEPAAALLERIRSESAGTDTRADGRQRRATPGGAAKRARAQVRRGA